MTSRVDLAGSRRSSGLLPGKRGFTLLELIIAVTLLAAFILPMLQLIAEARVRAVRYTNQRRVRDLAQRKLHDRIHHFEEENEGTFEAQGRPDWTWIIDPATIHSQDGGQVILEYKIHITLPQKLQKEDSTEGDSTYEYTIWSRPDEGWYAEQDDLVERGLYSPLHGFPDGTRY